ncbi:glucan biosynthesis protein [Martelella alba]|uniref:Glucans biosynthesis protein G n=1 Tax=Martelella alba TaxID=2590451 RepID=A0A506UGU4_9HYPH|nr:glucan biosynthesis protein G [Martelella alba]TPW32519.1 glucan biosynthesis protein [Martelella alba]
MKRRTFLAQTAMGALAVSSLAGPVLADGDQAAVEASQPVAQPKPAMPTLSDNATPFSFDGLTQLMKEKAGEPYVEPKQTSAGPFDDLSYDEFRAIRYDPNKAIWRDRSDFQMNVFPLGWLYKNPVGLYEIAGGKARQFEFTADDFIYQPPLDASRFAGAELPGVAGFRLNYPLNRKDVSDELISFLGASYFRALGKGSLYGLSARGLAVNTATNAGEEFPMFTDFYIQRPQPDDESITVFAALDSKSVTGAYRFVITPGMNTRMEVSARLFFRADINRLGIAPMTSMYLFGPANHHAFDDYRERVHDSEGLKIIRSDRTEVWRSLENPKKLANSYLGETSPRAFGLYQRHRSFDDYQDAEAHYERRPSLLVEPLSDWGDGTVSLVEIPTALEINDNIVCFWQPKAPAKAGGSASYDYRLTWGSIEEDQTRLARVVELRSGEGGVSGNENDDGTRKFVVDFAGGSLADLPAGTEVKAHVTATNAEIVHSTVSQVNGQGVWRLAIDLKPDGDKPVELVGSLNDGAQDLSEIWLYQWRVGDEKPN